MARNNNIECEEPRQLKKDKKVLTLFLVIVPSFLLAMTAAITETWTRIFFQVVLLLFQIVTVKNLIDSYNYE